MAYDHSGAVAYFKTENHPRGAVFSGAGEPRQKAAVAHAKRLLSRALRSDIDDETVDATTQYRPDYAVYEQALFLIENGVIANAEQSGLAFIASSPDPAAPAKTASPDTIAPEALRWLGVRDMGVVCVKG